MQKKFIKTLIIVMIIAMFSMLAVIFVMLNFKAKSDSTSIAQVQVSQVKRKIEENNASINSLKESLNEGNIAKTRAFAYMIQKNPSIIENQQELQKIKELLDVDELHIMDENGVLLWGSEPSMFGFDFSTSEQTIPFLKALEDKSFELAQEPQLNGALNVLFQYIGVSRYDKKGIVQTGVSPTRLENALKNNDISNVISGITVGSEGYIFALNEEGNIIAHKDSSFIDKEITELGLEKDFILGDTSGFEEISGEDVFYYYEKYDDMYICAAIPCSEVYESRNLIMIIFFISLVIIFGILSYAINNMIKVKVIHGIDSIIESLNKITNGNLDERVDVNTNEEFTQLSNGINNMVNSIKAKIYEANKLANEEKLILKKVQDISLNISDFSNKVRIVSNSVDEGVEEQKNAVEMLLQSFERVEEQVKTTGSKSESVYQLSQKVKAQLTSKGKDIKNMTHSMEIISDYSKKIEAIIKSIDDIAYQTNILSVNAAIEAARAGEAGKGFSVVADEVRALSLKTSESASGTAELIEEVIGNIKIGNENVIKTAEAFEEIISDIQNFTSIIDEIIDIMKKQNESFDSVKNELENINVVVKRNSDTVRESNDASMGLFEQAEGLIRVVESVNQNYIQ